MNAEDCAPRLTVWRVLPNTGRVFEERGGGDAQTRWQVRFRTYRVVLEHAHGMRGARPGELVEEARHGHGHEAHRDDAGFRFFVCRRLRSAQLHVDYGEGREGEEGGELGRDQLFLAMTALRRSGLAWWKGEARVARELQNSGDRLTLERGCASGSYRERP